MHAPGESSIGVQGCALPFTHGSSPRKSGQAALPTSSLLLTQPLCMATAEHAAPHPGCRPKGLLSSPHPKGTATNHTHSVCN